MVKIDKKQKIWLFAFVKNVIIIFVKRFRKKEEISMHKYGPVIKMLSLVTKIGITMLTSVFLCMAIGMWIDKHFSTNLFLLFLILGIMGGISGVYSPVSYTHLDVYKRQVFVLYRKEAFHHIQI